MRRNLVRQEIPLYNKETGHLEGTKVIFHLKKFSQPQYGNMQAMWHQKNATAKINSKRQEKLRTIHE